MLTDDSGSAAAPRSRQRKVHVMFFTQALEGRLNLRVEHTEDRKVRKRKRHTETGGNRRVPASQQPYPEASPAGNDRSSRKRKLMF